MYMQPSSILNYYSSPFFYGFLTYIGTISLLAHVGILSLFTHIPLKTIFKPMPSITCLSVLFTFIAAPLGTIISGYLAEYFYGNLPIKYFQTIFFLICTATTSSIMQQLLRKKFTQLSYSENQKFLIITACISNLCIIWSLQIIGIM